MKHRKTLLLKLFLVLNTLVLSAWSTAQAEEHGEDVKVPFTVNAERGIFLSITDIHFDPFADTSILQKLNKSPASKWQQIFARADEKSFSSYGSDTNYPLLESALAAARPLGPEYDYILCSGDYLSHDFRSTYNQLIGGSEEEFQAFAIKTMTFVSNRLAETFEGVPIFGTLGNNDAICGDYMIAPESKLLAGISEQWATISQQPEAFGNFPVGGFYKVRHPTVPDHDIMVLNSIFWSIKYQDHCAPSRPNPGDGMMAWLHWELFQSTINGRTATLLMHVPPGINAYSTTRGFGGCKDRTTSFWQDAYTTGFLKLLQTYRGVVTNVFAGHTHMDDFLVVKVAHGDAQIPVQITPSVSPIFDNNPGFKVVLYDKGDGDVLNSATFRLANLEQASQGKNPRWQLEYVADTAYGLSDLSGQSLRTLASKIVTDENIRSAFIKYYAVEAPPGDDPMTEQNWQAFACAQTTVTSSAFENCYCSQDR